MNGLEVFCRQVRDRSAEHRQAMLAVSHLPGQMVSILRQELDSLVRVIFLLAQDDRSYREQLVEASVQGARWKKKGSNAHVTDRDMVILADKLHNWTKSVYAFGCAFIHLSNLHDYRTRDPLAQIPADERNAVLRHLRYYHGGPAQELPTFADVVPFLPRVFEKIADNLRCYVDSLEAGKSLDD
jgi:hypothetical protein